MSAVIPASRPKSTWQKLYEYRFYDTPEGEDVFKKLFITSKYATVAGFVVGSHDVIMYSKPIGLMPTVARYLFWTVPFVSMAVAFTTTVHITTTLKGKCDRLNYFLGGFAAGCVIGIWTKSRMNAFNAGLILGCFGIAKRQSIEENFSLFYTPKVKVNSSIWNLKSDYSIWNDGVEKGWVAQSDLDKLKESKK